MMLAGSCRECDQEIYLTVGAALVSTAAAYADTFKEEGPKGLVIFQYLQDSTLCVILILINIFLASYVIAKQQVDQCVLEFGLQLVALAFLVSTLATLNQKGSQLVPSLDMMLLTDTSFVTGILHVITLASQREEDLRRYRDRALDPSKRPLEFMYNLEELGNQDEGCGGLLAWTTFVRASETLRGLQGIRGHLVELSSAFVRIGHFMVTVPITEGFAAAVTVADRRLDRKESALLETDSSIRISRSKKLSLDEWCIGVVVVPITLVVEVIQHGAAILFHLIGVLIHTPRLLAGIMVWLSLAAYTYYFGGMQAFQAARHHRHWDEQIELDTELRPDQLYLGWEVSVLQNDRGQSLRIAEDVSVVVKLGANLWKENGVDTDEAEAQKYQLPYKEHPPLSAYFATAYLAAATTTESNDE